MSFGRRSPSGAPTDAGETLLRSAIHSERTPLAADRVVLTIGTFDGVHRGHQALLRAARTAADERGAALVVLTFDPLPRTVLGRGDYPPLLPVERRVSLLQVHGADVVDVLHFDHDVASIEYPDFMDALLARYPIEHVVLGYDFALGRGRRGTAGRLAELGHRRGFTVQTEPPVLDEDGEPISSSRIRERILAGDISRAARLLSRPLVLAGQPGRLDLVDWSGSAMLVTGTSSQMLPAPGRYAAVLTRAGDAIPVSVVVEPGTDASIGQRVWHAILPFEDRAAEDAGEYTLQLVADHAASAHAVIGSGAGYWGG